MKNRLKFIGTASFAAAALNVIAVYLIAVAFYASGLSLSKIMLTFIIQLILIVILPILVIRNFNKEYQSLNNPEDQLKAHNKWANLIFNICYIGFCFMLFELIKVLLSGAISKDSGAILDKFIYNGAPESEEESFATQSFFVQNIIILAFGFIISAIITHYLWKKIFNPKTVVSELY